MKFSLHLTYVVEHFGYSILRKQYGLKFKYVDFLNYEEVEKTSLHKLGIIY